MRFYPYIGRGGGVLAMLKGATKSFEVILPWELEVLAIGLLRGDTTSFHPLKGRGHKKLYPVLWGFFLGGGGGGGRKMSLSPK